MSKHTTQSNPNNGSAVQKIKINLQIHIRAEGGDVFIQKKNLFFAVGTVPVQDPIKPVPHLDPVVPEISRLLLSQGLRA